MHPDATAFLNLPPRRRIFLMRHGEVDYFAADGTPLRPESVPLNAEGRAQGLAAASALTDLPLDRVITSGLERATQTALLACGGRELPTEHDRRLREIETGRLSDWAGADLQQVARAFREALPATLGPHDRFLAGETFGELRSRVLSAWSDLLARRDWTHALVVAHGVVNRVLLGHLLGSGLAGLGNLEQDAGCINLVEVGDDGVALVRLLNFSPLHPVKAGLIHGTLEGLFRQFLRGRVAPSRET